jgi:hypothetical protein
VCIERQSYSALLFPFLTHHESGSLPRTINGPHGLHNVNDSRWYDDGHEDFYENNKNTCKACHGEDLKGTPLAKMATSRSFRVEDRTIIYAKGDLLRCDDCHGMPEL